MSCYARGPGQPAFPSKAEYVGPAIVGGAIVALAATVVAPEVVGGFVAARATGYFYDNLQDNAGSFIPSTSGLPNDGTNADVARSAAALGTVLAKESSGAVAVGTTASRTAKSNREALDDMAEAMGGTGAPGIGRGGMGAGGAGGGGEGRRRGRGRSSGGTCSGPNSTCANGRGTGNWDDPENEGVLLCQHCLDRVNNRIRDKNKE